MAPLSWKDVHLQGREKSIPCHPDTSWNTLHVFNPWLLQLTFQTFHIQRTQYVNPYRNTSSGFRIQTLHSPTRCHSRATAISKVFFPPPSFPVLNPWLKILSLRYLSAQPCQKPYPCVRLKRRQYVRGCICKWKAEHHMHHCTVEKVCNGKGYPVTFIPLVNLLPVRVQNPSPRFVFYFCHTFQHKWN